MKVARRQRGSTSIVLVLMLGAILAVTTLSSGSHLDPAAREIRRTRASDQAWALAEAGVEWARLSAVDPETPRTMVLELDVGRVEVEISTDAGALAVHSRGFAPDGSAVGSEAVRTVRVGLEPGEEGAALVVTSWEER